MSKYKCPHCGSSDPNHLCAGKASSGVNKDQELDALVRRIHFSQSDWDELTPKELYEDVPDECLQVINSGLAAVQAYVDQRCKKARIAEIKVLLNIFDDQQTEAGGGNGIRLHHLKRRIAELRKEV